MPTVTERISQIKQPYGGYIKLSDFRKEEFDDGITLNERENIPGSIIGTAVEYLTRLSVSGENVSDVFANAVLGASVAKFLYDKTRGKLGVKDADEVIAGLLRGVNAHDFESSAVNVCKAAAFDAYYRNPMSAVQSAGYEDINPDSDTVMNIQTMTNRSVELFRERGPVVKAGFDFTPNGYTETVSNGDGDFLTADTLWDMKVYRSRLTKDHTLQVLMYWIMGQHSGQEIYSSITKIGLFNPRTNTAYTLKVKNIPEGVIETVEREVICC